MGGRLLSHLIQGQALMPVAVVTAEEDGNQVRPRVRLSEYKMAEAELQMNGEAGELVLLRDQAGSGGNHAGMLLKGILQTVRQLGWSSSTSEP